MLVVKLEKLESVFIPRTKKLTFWIILEGTKKDGKIISMYLKLLILGMNLIFNSSLQMKDA